MPPTERGMCITQGGRCAHQFEKEAWLSLMSAAFTFRAELADPGETLQLFWRSLPVHTHARPPHAYHDGRLTNKWGVSHGEISTRREREEGGRGRKREKREERT